jgi:hypothetical protein
MDDILPIEILEIITSHDIAAYKALLAYLFGICPKPFARCMSSNAKYVDYMIFFGYSIEITCRVIVWYLNGERHGSINPKTIPTVEYVGDAKMWYSNDVLHRVDNPAIESADGSKIWMANGFMHRQARHGEPDGPAAVFPDGHNRWALYGDIFTNRNDWLYKLSKLKKKIKKMRV